MFCIFAKNVDANFRSNCNIFVLMLRHLLFVLEVHFTMFSFFKVVMLYIDSLDPYLGGGGGRVMVGGGGEMSQLVTEKG